MKVDYPKHLQDSFKGRRWSSASPKELLDYKGVEVLLVGEDNDSISDLAREMGVTDSIDSQVTDDSIYTELHITKNAHPIEPLVYGKWK